MNLKLYSALAVLALFAAAAVAGNADYAEQERQLMRYCERVVQFEVQALRGIPLELRNGHRDYKGIAEEHCPGMRPAP